MFRYRYLKVSAVDVRYMRVFVPKALGSHVTFDVLVTKGTLRIIGENPQRLPVILLEVSCDTCQWSDGLAVGSCRSHKFCLLAIVPRGSEEGYWALRGRYKTRILPR